MAVDGDDNENGKLPKKRKMDARSKNRSDAELVIDNSKEKSPVKRARRAAKVISQSIQMQNYPYKFKTNLIFVFLLVFPLLKGGELCG